MSSARGRLKRVKKRVVLEVVGVPFARRAEVVGVPFARFVVAFAATINSLLRSTKENTNLGLGACVACCQGGGGESRSASVRTFC